MSIYLDVEFVNVNCGPSDRGGCGLEFAMTKDFYDQTKRTGETWYCPKGHPRIWGSKTIEQQLADAQSREVALNDQLSAAVREAETVRVALLRDRQRFANGVCPCCNRSFGNVRRHMQSKHPDYDATRVDQPGTVKFKCSCGRSFDSLRGLRTHQGAQRRDGWEKRAQSNDQWTRRGAHLTNVG